MNTWWVSVPGKGVIIIDAPGPLEVAAILMRMLPEPVEVDVFKAPKDVTNPQMIAFLASAQRQTLIRFEDLPPEINVQVTPGNFRARMNAANN